MGCCHEELHGVLIRVCHYFTLLQIIVLYPSGICPRSPLTCLGCRLITHHQHVYIDHIHTVQYYDVYLHVMDIARYSVHGYLHAPGCALRIDNALGTAVYGTESRIVASLQSSSS